MWCATSACFEGSRRHVSGGRNLPFQPKCLPDKFARIWSRQRYKLPMPPKILLILSWSFRRETWHCSADIQGPLSVNCQNYRSEIPRILKSAAVKTTHIPNNPQHVSSVGQNFGQNGSTKIRANLVFQVLEVFQDTWRSNKQSLVHTGSRSGCWPVLGLLGTYLALHACISFCSVSDKSGASLSLPSSHKSAFAKNYFCLLLTHFRPTFWISRNPTFDLLFPFPRC